MIGLIRPKKPDYVTLKQWVSLSRKEKDYLYMISMENKPCKDDIKRMLYIETDRGLQKLRNRVLTKIGQLSRV